MSAPLRVLMVSAEYPPARGGVGDYTERLVAELETHGMAIMVLAGESRVSHGQEDGPIVRVAGGWGWRSWGKVAEAVQRHQARIVHIQYQAGAYGMHPAANLLPGYIRTRFPLARVVTTFHDIRVPYLFPKAGPLRPAAIRAMDRLSHATVLTNRTDLEALGGEGTLGSTGAARRRHIPLGTSVEPCPPDGFDREGYRSRFGAGQGPLLSYFGLMNDSKGVEEIVDALALLKERGLDARLLAIGGDTGESDPANAAYRDRVLRRIQDSGVSDRVNWTGHLSSREVSAALLSSDICVLPFRDGVTFRRSSLMAAMAHGLPIITTFPDRPEPPLVDGVNVAMVPRCAPAALTASIERLWRDETIRTRLGAAAGELSQQYSWPRIAALHSELYRTLLA